ncbi:ABC transporter permease [Planctomycetota bacterium]|nr:ABC transporter permease [Planctomycetota bacterium]
MPVANPFTYVRPGQAVSVIAVIGRATLDFLNTVGELTVLLGAVVRAWFGDPQRRSVVSTQLYHIGYLSLPVVLVFGFFLGLVVAVQAFSTLVKFKAEVMCGPMVNYSLLSQLAPTFTALIFAGRVGSNMAAEIGTMQVTEQVDALRVMGTDPIAHLVAPRVLACLLLLPVLTAVAGLTGMISASFLCINVWGVDAGGYWFQSTVFCSWYDVASGLTKTLFFGAIIALVCCRQGLATAGGATGVGQSVTRGVVQASVAVMVANFALTLVSNQLWYLLLAPK